MKPVGWEYSEFVLFVVVVERHVLFLQGMKSAAKHLLTVAQEQELLQTLQDRFLNYPNRHPNCSWEQIEHLLVNKRQKLWSLYQMEHTGGEPDVVVYDAQSQTLQFFDCAAESPKGRRSICYDREALEARKEFKPEHNAMDLAAEMGIELLDETKYRFLQQLGPFDTKTSSWIQTPAAVRKQGGALFGDFRYGQAFIYHNGAGSYYAARGFRGCLEV